MGKIKGFFAALVLSLWCAKEMGFAKLKAFGHDERGDTNFISIIVVLGIVLVVAAAFFVFRDTVMTFFEENIPDFLQ